jgi:rubrerythrin
MIRQELVTEMILEPITGVDSSEYSVTMSESTEDTPLLQQAIRLEDNMGRFYSSTASLIPMKEVQRAFLRLAKENGNRKVIIEKIISNS